MSSDIDELLRFRDEWKKELKGTSSNSSLVDKDVLSIQFDEESREITDNDRPSVDNTNNPADLPTEEIVILSLPNPETKQQQNSEGSKCKKRKIITPNNEDENLLELLIADIDEITVIPFFDIQLPKEIGLKIFKYLSVKDLCSCACVSKSWKNLAEDELVWLKCAFQLGCIGDESLVSENPNWKGFVQECVIEQRQLRSRWKERICRTGSMEYERGGSLCAVSLADGLVCAGYSANAILLWDLRGPSGPSYRLLDKVPEVQQNSYPTCTAVTDTLCAAGFSDGSIGLWHTSLSAAPLYRCRLDGLVKTVVLATYSEPRAAAISDHELRIDVADENGQWRCFEQKTFETKIQDIKMLPCKKEFLNQPVVIATRDAVHLHSTIRAHDTTILDHVIGGKITCLDCSRDDIAIGIGPYGYGVLGNTVRVYRSETGRLLSVLPGHYHEITCLNLHDSPPGQIITGSFDKRVRVFDLRTESIAITLRGNEDYVTTIQMDDWKVVSGANNGDICVWDQRTASLLWHTHARHPVRLCRFDGVHMVSANIPHDKNPQPNVWADDLIVHRRSRGALRVFDFSSDNATQGVPDICSSSYDDTTGYNYNIALVAPYDNINE